jgi:hypothetical protein
MKDRRNVRARVASMARDVLENAVESVAVNMWMSVRENVAVNVRDSVWGNVVETVRDSATSVTDSIEAAVEEEITNGGKNDQLYS